MTVFLICLFLWMFFGSAAFLWQTICREHVLTVGGLLHCFIFGLLTGVIGFFLIMFEETGAAKKVIWRRR